MQKAKVVFGFLLPTDQNPAESVHPTVSAFNHPTSGSGASFPFERASFLAPRANMRREAKFNQDIPHFLVIVALVQADPLGMLGGGLGAFNHQTLDGLTHHFHIMPIGPLHRQPHRDAMAFGQQATFDAALAPVGGIGAGFLPAQGRFGDGAIHTQPGPIETLEFIKLGDANLPQLQKYAGLDPRLIAIMGCRVGTELGLIQRLPLTAGAQHIEDGVGTQALRDSGTATAESVRVDVDWQQGLQDVPQGVGHSIISGRIVIGTSGTRSLGIVCCYFHTPSILIIIQSDTQGLFG